MWIRQVESRTENYHWEGGGLQNCFWCRFRRQLRWSPRKAQAPGRCLVAPADSGRLLGKDMIVQAPLISPSHVRGARLVGKEHVLHFRDQEPERRPDSCSKAISPPTSVCQSLSRFRLLLPHGLQPARLLCPWDSPGKNTGVGCHFLLQTFFLISTVYLVTAPRTGWESLHLTWCF